MAVWCGSVGGEYGWNGVDVVLGSFVKLGDWVLEMLEFVDFGVFRPRYRCGKVIVGCCGRHSYF